MAALYGLGALVVVLLGVWYIQHRSTRLRRQALELFRNRGWSAAISDQDSAVLHGRVSAVFCDVVREIFACEGVLLVRNLPSGMELQAASGVRLERPDTLRFVPSANLTAVITPSVSTFDLVEVSQHLPPQTVVTLRDVGLISGCCVVNAGRLDGFCFFSPPRTLARVFVRRALPDLMVLLDFIWQAIDRFGEVTMSATEPPSEDIDSRAQLMTTMFKAIRFRHADTLVKKLATMIQKQIKLDRMAFIFASSTQVGDTHVVAEGLLTAFELPTGFSFTQAFGRVAGLRPFDPLTVAKSPDLPQAIEHRLQACGLRHVTPIPLSSRRMGILAWTDDRPPESVAKLTEELFQPVNELVENAEAFELLQELSYTDPLTGLANQRYFQRRLREELTRAGRYHRALAFILIDLDDLKVINDRHGHQAGDDVLRRIGSILKDSVRSMDVVVRYGGDEFGIIMPETGEADCERFMIRLQKAFASEHLLAGPRQEMITYHMSMGGAVYPLHGTNSEQLVFASDMALLKAKETGRNTWKLFTPELLPTPGARR